MRKIEIFCLVLVGAFLLGMASQKSLQKCSRIEERVKVDTLVIFDTIRLIEPKIERITRVERVPVPVVDTLRVKDTLFVYLDREQKQYTNPNFDAWVSGIEPRLDSIKLYPKTKIVEVEKIVQTQAKKKHWGIGVQMGFGCNPEGFTPYIGVGVNYNLFSW